MPMTADALKTYSSRLVVSDDGEVVGTTDAPADTDPGAELDRLAREYVHNHPSLSYQEALERVMVRPENRTLVAEYASPSYKPKPIPLPDQSPMPKRHGDEVDRRTKAYMAEQNVSYGEALQAVLKSNPELAKAYAGVGNDV